MAHIPHYGTPGYSHNPTSQPPPSSPLALALRRALPAQGPAPPSPLLKAASPQDSPSLRHQGGNKIKVCLSCYLIRTFPVCVHR